MAVGAQTLFPRSIVADNAARLQSPARLTLWLGRSAPTSPVLWGTIPRAISQSLPNYPAIEDPDRQDKVKNFLS